MAVVMPTTPVVMISSTSVDLSAHRQALKDVCLEMKVNPLMMEHMPSSTGAPLHESLAMVDRADVYVGLIAHRYGTVPRGHNLSITEMEYRRATKRRIPRLIFRMHEDHLVKAKDVDRSPRTRRRMNAFCRLLTSQHVVRSFTSVEHLQRLAMHALHEHFTLPPAAAAGPLLVHPAVRRVAVLNRTASVTDGDAQKVVSALQEQVRRDFAPAWGTDATLVFVPRGARAPSDVWSLSLVDDVSGQTALGYYHRGRSGQPCGVVSVMPSTAGVPSWTLRASHLLLDILINPTTSLTVYRQLPRQGARFWAYEVCNPCAPEKFGYDIDGVRVSDFILPAWFDSSRSAKATRFDHRGHMIRPFQILPGGYTHYLDVEGDGERRGWRVSYSRDPTRAGA